MPSEEFNQTITQAEVVAAILRIVEECGSQQAAAARLGIDAGYLNNIVRGHRPPGTGALAKLGYERVVFYRRVSQQTRTGQGD